ncbi:BREX-2 system adenine-specific DNA-methyltransferase PglX [Kitasatospora aureofaciens]|uniref:BREX-2 system adenine-specific DNA-methyltransferase PglX n=1 Tax=Kitasatospora aureofaciens TaxID=1894 RepID=UPI0027E1494F|nr:BREX-2 system adenine-specific DNA-methyltransferase PglX [Kitasatospora aureofaciens]
MDQNELLKDLRKQVAALEDDLRERSQDVPEFAATLEDEYRRARAAERTAATFESWREERITQAAVAWALGTVFVRFCEDNGLIEWPWIAGPGERLVIAEERHEAYFRENPEQNDRDWLVAAFDHLAAANETAGGLFDRNHNPLWGLTPSFEAARALLAFWRRRGEDGEAVHLFESEDWDTRFLGDLYQNLSEHARKTYALLQTPEFVEEFILDLTLEPAVEEFGLWPELTTREGESRPIVRRGLRTIDPACGSGHFLLGLFQRLLAKYRAEAGPGVDDWANVRAALDAVHGCDKNPFAVSIARFRLLLAALKAAGVERLDLAPNFPINVAVGDSLLHGRGVGKRKQKGKSDDDLFAALGMSVDADEAESDSAFAYSTEDVNEFVHSCDLLGRHSYHVVVGNPPYITVKDKHENGNYRDAYSSCAGTYALSVPFAQRIFDLATREHQGFTGQITSNSFMKREFGKKLIEEFFRTQVKLTHVIDTSGAYIPGHGTPTVILIGRNTDRGWGDPIRAVLGILGEPGQPEDAAKGSVWRAIVEQVGSPGGESNWVTVEDANRDRFAAHPWSVSGGGAADLQAQLERMPRRLGDLVGEIGFGAVTREDGAYMVGGGTLNRKRIDAGRRRPLVEGDVVRDFAIADTIESLWPYGADSLEAEAEAEVLDFLWPYRSILRERVAFGATQLERGLEWYEYSMFFTKRYRMPLSISFAFVATHNHFVLDRGGRVFSRSAPVIKLPAGVSEKEHLDLLGVLNSSVACFWLKQVSQAKSGADNTSGGGNRWSPEAWMKDYEFTGTRLVKFPVPAALANRYGSALDELAQELAMTEPAAIAADQDSVPNREALRLARVAHTSTRQRMIAIQEELDWWAYGAYGMLKDGELAALTAENFSDVPEVALGERAFEIVLARKAVGNSGTAWFKRHRSTPVTEIPARWPQWYRDVVQRRIDVIDRRRDIALIERPECKRRWSMPTWEKREEDALRTWLLDRCEREDLWFYTRDGMRQPRTLTPAGLADLFSQDADVHAVAELYAADHLGKRDLRLADVLREILTDEHVPYLAALRYKDSGLRKREQWETVWEQQREEDRTGERLEIAVPSKYSGADFRKHSYWSNRGKLDVAKERFISYPDAGPEADPKLVLGWAGWDHRDQAQAIINLVTDRVERDNWQGEQLIPLLAGMLELLPWLKQWHGEFDPEWDGNPATDCQEWLEAQQREHGITTDAVLSWRPSAPKRGRAAAK